MMHRRPLRLLQLIVVVLWVCLNAGAADADDSSVVRVFIFAGQSNMVGSDSHVEDISQYPPFRGLESPQQGVRFSYCIGRENKRKSDGWVDLQPVNNVVGPELSFAREVTTNEAGPIAIIKVAAGGTHLGGDWNPDSPSGFEMYPLALSWVRDALNQLKNQGVQYRLEGFMWHQGENDMFNDGYRESYGDNLRRFIQCWRRDLDAPNLRFYVGELCTKTIWGMDLRPRMYAISLGQKEVCEEDPRAQYVPTSHVAVEIGRGVGLHYHYGTLGQLEHGINYAEAYRKNQGVDLSILRPLTWPHIRGSKVKLFILAGHRNMEGERAFVQHVQEGERRTELLDDDPSVPFRYSLGGGVKVSHGWEPLGPAGYYETFGPELSFSAAVKLQEPGNIAIAKFTHSGSQIIDWTPEGSVAESRDLYPRFRSFIKQAIAELEAKNHDVEVAGIFYHVSENDMSWGQARKKAATRIGNLIRQLREDLGMPELMWYVTQQPPTADERVAKIDVTSQIEAELEKLPHVVHIQAFDLPEQDKQLVIDSDGIIWLGEQMAAAYLGSQ